MTDDERLRVQKDTWWEIRVAQKTIACLDQQVKTSVDAMKAVIAAWENGQLGAVAGNLVLCKADQEPHTLKKFSDPAALAALVEELEATKANHKSLEDSLSRM